MPDMLDAIRTRRSIRKYQPKAVSQEVVTEVLETAGLAPSAHNAQPWRFIVLTDSSLKRELAEAMAKSWAADMAKDSIKIDKEMRNSKVERFSAAPTLILACSTIEDMNIFPDKNRQSIERDLALQSLGAAMQNLLLAIHAKGLGACWFCAPAFCKQTVRTSLNIPEGVEPQALVALGYPAEKPHLPPRKTLGDYCFMRKWGSGF
jgi:coenzyme F420-0:L-glutamate ligase / coenzyme F420-1:gamma-L-glutamate ligase